MNWPCWKIVEISGSASSSRPSIAGTEISRVMRRPQSSEREKPSRSVLTWCRASAGRITVPKATPNTPSGSSRKRSASDSQDCEPSVSLAAMTVSSSRLICATDEPNRVGTISVITLRTPGWFQPQRGRVSRSMPFNEGSWNSSCSRPAASTAQPRARICFSGVPPSRGASHSAPALMHRLRMTGVSAGIAKRWKLFSAPPAKAVSETNSRNGKVRRNRSISRPCLAGSVSTPLAKTDASCGAKISASAVTSISTPPRVPAVRAISSRSSAWLRVSFTSVNTGTNAVAKEPSANSRRRKLGILKATQKASVMALVPKVEVTTWSRTRPRTRETMVMLLNDSRPRNILGELTQRPS
ncbi:hypothetical protein D3C73_1003770 [compost metagenome]